MSSFVTHTYTHTCTQTLSHACTKVPVLKDLNLLEGVNTRLFLQPEQLALVNTIIARDCQFLQQNDIMVILRSHHKKSAHAHTHTHTHSLCQHAHHSLPLLLHDEKITIATTTITVTTTLTIITTTTATITIIVTSIIISITTTSDPETLAPHHHSLNLSVITAQDYSLHVGKHRRSPTQTCKIGVAEGRDIYFLSIIDILQVITLTG